MKTNSDFSIGSAIIRNPLGSASVVSDSRDQSNETRAGWQFITSNKAWSLAEKDGKAPPYAGYLIELSDGRRLRCRKDAHKTVFEISETSGKADTTTAPQ